MKSCQLSEVVSNNSTIWETSNWSSLCTSVYQT